MKRLRATVDIYVDMDDDISEEEALSWVNQQIDNINTHYEATGDPVSASEIIQHEIYDTEEEK